MEYAGRAVLPRTGSFANPVPGRGPSLPGRTTLQAAVGICLLVQPEIVVGAVIVIGVVVVASAIAAEIAKAEALERRSVRGPCMCRCFGPWTPTGDPDEGNPDAGRRAYDAECRSECVYRGFLPSNYTCQ